MSTAEKASSPPLCEAGMARSQSVLSGREFIDFIRHILSPSDTHTGAGYELPSIYWGKKGTTGVQHPLMVKT